VTNPENEHLQDLNGRELATLVPLVALCFWIGIYPKPVLEFLHGPMARLASTVQPGRFDASTPAAHGAPTAHAAEPVGGTEAAPPPATLLTEPAIVPAGH
jgi:NADH-quinone oxidoreductase subunit M